MPIGRLEKRSQHLMGDLRGIRDLRQSLVFTGEFPIPRTVLGPVR